MYLYKDYPFCDQKADHIKCTFYITLQCWFYLLVLPMEIIDQIATDKDFIFCIVYQRF